MILDCFDPNSPQNVASREAAMKAKVITDVFDGIFPRFAPRPRANSAPVSENGGPGAELSEAEEVASNPSEAEAMGPLRRYMDDVTSPPFPADVTMKTQELSTSMVSGLEDLALSMESGHAQQEDNREESNSSPPPLEASNSSEVIEEVELDEAPGAVDDSDGSVVNTSYLFNDSVDWYLSKVTNESQIITLSSSEDSVDITGQENMEDQDPNLDDDADLFYDDQFNDAYVVMGFNLRKK